MIESVEVSELTSKRAGWMNYVLVPVWRENTDCIGIFCISEIEKRKRWDGNCFGASSKKHKMDFIKFLVSWF